MKTLEKSQDRIAKICEHLREGTIEPAKVEAKRILEDARKKALEIEAEAERHAEELLKSTHASLEKEKKLFQSSLEQSLKQAVETLRQTIQHQFFQETLGNLLEREMNRPEWVAKLISGMVDAMSQQGVRADLQAVIAKTVSPQEVIASLIREFQKTPDASFLIQGSLRGGAQLKWSEGHFTLDCSEEAVRDLLAAYVHKQFRHLLFKGAQE